MPITKLSVALFCTLLAVTAALPVPDSEQYAHQNVYYQSSNDPVLGPNGRPHGGPVLNFGAGFQAQGQVNFKKQLPDFSKLEASLHNQFQGPNRFQGMRYGGNQQNRFGGPLGHRQQGYYQG